MGLELEAEGPAPLSGCASSVTWGPASSLHTPSLFSQVLLAAPPTPTPTGDSIAHVLAPVGASSTWGISLHSNFSVQAAGAVAAW